VDYKKHYDKLISTRMPLKRERYFRRKNGEYFEGHHIIPKSKGGKGTSSRGLNCDNIVILTAREHYIAHWLLWKIHKDRSSALGFHKMLSCNKNQKRIVSSYAYEESRLAFSKTNIGNQYGKGKTKVISQEQKDKLSKLMKGKRKGIENAFYGKNHSNETKIILSEKAKNRINEKNYKYKGLKEVSKNGQIIAYFKSHKEVSNFIGCSMSNVRNVLGGNQKTAMGYIVKHSNNNYLKA
jgi:hypothetical protein